MIAHDVISFFESQNQPWIIAPIKTLLPWPEPSSRHRCHFQHAECKTPEPGTVLYSSDPLGYLHYPEHVKFNETEDKLMGSKLLKQSNDYVQIKVCKDVPAFFQNKTNN